jgi:hypothetical protein
VPNFSTLRPSVPRAVLVQRHARNRRDLWRLINSTAWIALARHAGAAIASIRALAVTASGAIGMLLADQSVLSQFKHAMSYKIDARSRMVESGNLPGPPRVNESERQHSHWDESPGAPEGGSVCEWRI